MTYGWAILAVLIVGVVLWQMGLFDFDSKLSPGYSGYSIVVPLDWAFSRAGPSSCSLSVVFANGAGESLREIGIGGNPCVPEELQAGQSTICSFTPGNCGAVGKSFEEELIVEYKRSSDNQTFQSAGVLWGNVEGT